VNARTALLLLAAAAAASCSQAPRLDLDPDSAAFFDTARLVMTSEEQDIFRHLPDPAAREEFITDFWAKRDPDPSTPENEFQTEFQARVDYANRRFREGRRGYDTDRGRIYIYLGPPEQTETYQRDPSQGPLLVWYYYTYELAVTFVDQRGDGAYTYSEILGSLLQAIEDAKLGGVVQTGAKYLRFDLTYDKAARLVRLAIPVKRLSFREEAGRLKADFNITLYIYEESGLRKRVVEERRAFEGTADEVRAAKEIVFEFAQPLPPGKTYLDVVLQAEDMGKARRIVAVRG
jgi:GWxTD domain-containing protein